MSSSRYWRRRLGRHLALGALSAILITLVVTVLGGEGARVFRLSMGTAYASLALLAWALLVGPWNVIRRRANPVSTDLRRDIGIWGAGLGIVHMVFGLQVHLPGRMLEYFLWARSAGHRIPFRYDIAGVTNWSGLGAAIILLGLAAISNDVSLRRFGARRWKSLQRWNYAAFALIALHGAVYQLLEKRTPGWVVTYALVLVVVLATQVHGLRTHGERRPVTGADAS